MFAILGALLVTLSHAQAAEGVPPPFIEEPGEHRLEQRTPPGPVPPAAPRRVSTELPMEQPYLGDPRTARDAQVTATGPDEAAVVAAFAAAYRRAGTPRMAVYFNRELSDEVREWIPGDRTVREATLDDQSRSSGSASIKARADVVDTEAGELGSAKVKGHSSFNASASRQMRATESETQQTYVDPTGKRRDPSEAWKWEFEDAVAGLMLQGRAKLVDRALIFRLMAKHAPQRNGMAGTISTTENETAALENYADVLIEILVTRSAIAGVGYDFRATAKEVKTGRLIATAFVDGSHNSNPVTRRRTTDARGYTVEKNQAPITVEGVSRALALKLMQSLSASLAG